MTFGVHVAGGTGAGRKRPLRDRQVLVWRCSCPFPNEMQVADTNGHPVNVRHETHRLNPGYLVRCIDCGTDRP